MRCRGAFPRARSRLCSPRVPPAERPRPGPGRQQPRPSESRRFLAFPRLRDDPARRRQAVEIDLGAIGDGKVIPWEAKSSSTLATSDRDEKRDTARLITACRALTAGVLCLATTQPAWSLRTRALFRPNAIGPGSARSASKDWHRPSRAHADRRQRVASDGRRAVGSPPVLSMGLRVRVSCPALPGVAAVSRAERAVLLAGCGRRAFGRAGVVYFFAAGGYRRRSVPHRGGPGCWRPR